LGNSFAAMTCAGPLAGGNADIEQTSPKGPVSLVRLSWVVFKQRLLLARCRPFAVLKMR